VYHVLANATYHSYEALRHLSGTVSSIMYVALW
jgi:hypothetical protein